MPKRTSDVADLEQGASKAQDVGQSTARPIQEEGDEGMGEFEDRFEDDIESEEEIEEIERDAGEDDDDVGECFLREGNVVADSRIPPGSRRRGRG
jgi:ribosome assembly protein RRB1